MSDAEPAAPQLTRWAGGSLVPIEWCDSGETSVVAADSWLVTEGTVLALDLHRSRFLDAIPRDLRTEAERFWEAAVAAIPRDGDWFPRVDLRRTGKRSEFQFRLRASPPRERSVTLVTHRGRDPRRSPTVKGPDLESMLRLRTEAQTRGASESVIVSPEGYLVEGAYSALVWWRGDILAVPGADLERIDSITARSLQALAAALGVEVIEEHTTASELDGHEVWALSALHGPRIATKWVDGPSLAERPGRLDLWRRRLERLRRPPA